MLEIEQVMDYLLRLAILEYGWLSTRVKVSEIIKVEI